MTKDKEYRAQVGMSELDRAAIDAAQAGWREASKTGDRALMDAYHRQAEAIRAQYDYSGGGDGEHYIALGKPKQQTSSSYDLTAYLRQQQAAQTQAELEQLKAAYQKSLSGYDEKADKLPAQYDAARNQAAAQSALAKRSFDERAAASGLNSGAGGQAELARSAVLQHNLAGLDTAQAQDQAELDRSRADLRAEYESAIAQAQAKGEASLAAALYQELVRQQEMERAEASAAQAQRNWEAEAAQTQSNWAAEMALKAASLRASGTSSKQKEETATLPGGDIYSYLRSAGAATEGEAYAMLLGLGYQQTQAKTLAGYYKDALQTDAQAEAEADTAAAGKVETYARVLEGALRSGKVKLGDPTAAAQYLYDYMVRSGMELAEIDRVLDKMGY